MSDGRRWSVWLGPMAATLFALAVAGVQYRAFLEDPAPPLVRDPARPQCPLPDRPRSRPVDRRRQCGRDVPPPRRHARLGAAHHALLLMPIEMIAGPDNRLGVLPSLGGWVLTMVFGYLLARRIAPWGGDLAGIVAVLFIRRVAGASRLRCRRSCSRASAPGCR